MSKYYAIKKGRKTGIFSEWTEVKSYIDKFPGAIFKSFENKEDATKYLDESVYENNTKDTNTEISHHLFISGQFNKYDNTIVWGYLITESKNIVQKEIDFIKDQEISAPFYAEIIALKKAFDWLIDNHVGLVCIHYNYEGIMRWATGEWNPKTDLAVQYVKFIKSFPTISIQWMNRSNDTMPEFRKEIYDDSIKNYEDIFTSTLQINAEEEQKILAELGLDMIKTANEYTLKNVVFLTGGAGTGKSTLIEKIRNHIPHAVVLAPTGLAALNVKGQTIHSFFNLPIHLIDQKDIDRSWIFSHSLTHLFYLKLLIIDEVSMVRVDIMNAIDRILRLAKNNDKPFGGITVILVGDLYQLPPIIEKGVIENSPDLTSPSSPVINPLFELPLNEQVNEIPSTLIEWFNQTYGGIYFFNADVFKQYKLRIVELTTVHRQVDPLFIQTLSKIRLGNQKPNDLELFSSSLSEWVPTSTAVILTPTRRNANKINESFFEQINKPSILFQGNFVFEDLTKLGTKLDLPVDEFLYLKEGAKVILVANQFDSNFVNGTIGTISKLLLNSQTNKYEVYFKALINTKEEVLKIEAHTWEYYHYVYDKKEKKIKAKIFARYTQIPLIPAWAITIHKSQGLTMENVHINLEDGIFAAGQLYVALSRVKSVIGLSLSRHIKMDDIKVNSNVINYFSLAEENNLIKYVDFL